MIKIKMQQALLRVMARIIHSSSEEFTVCEEEEPVREDK
jgi:hypothetical protein